MPASGAISAEAAVAATPPVLLRPTETQIAVPAAPAVTAAPAATAAPAVTAAPAALNGDDPRQAVINAMHAVVTAGPYHIKSTTTSAGKTVLMTGEVVLPDHFHLITNGQEMLIIGNKTYLKQNGQWVDFPMDFSALVSGMVGALSSDAEKDISSVQRLGPDTINGAPATLYQFQQTLNVGGASVANTVRLWVDNQRGLPIQQQIDSTVSGVKSTTLQEITYDPGINISLP